MRSQILGWLGDSFWQLLWWWCECCYRGPTHKSQIWGWLSVAFWRWMPFSMKLNDEPWWKFSYQSSWDVWLVSFIPCFRGLCEDRLPCYNTTGLKKWRLKILFHNGPFCPEFMNIFAQIIKILHGGRGAESSHIQLPANGRALPTICWRTWSTPRPSQRPKAPPTLLKKGKAYHWPCQSCIWGCMHGWNKLILRLT